MDGRFQASPWYSPLWQGAVLTKFQPCFPQSLQWLSGESIQTRTWRVVSLILTWSSEFSNFFSDFFFQNILHAWTYRLYSIQLFCLQYSTNWKFNILPNIARLNFLYTTRCTLTLNVKQGLRTLQVQIRIGLKLDQRTVPTLPLYQLTTVC